MPRYLFHFHDGDLDDEGHDFPDEATARREAIKALCDVASDEVPKDGDVLGLSIHVTDTAGTPLFSARLDFKVDEVAKPPPRSAKQPRV